MNLILLEPEELTPDGMACVQGRRLRHIREVHRAEPGQRLRVGIVNGPMGEGELVAEEPDRLWLRVQADQPPPPSLPLTLLLALPRPKMLKRILQTVATLGVERLVLINSYRVEKSFWDSPFLQVAAIREELVLGLEQARDTRLPEVLLEKRFKPFVEDQLPAMAAGTRRLVAHPQAAAPCPVAVNAPLTLAIGPEGGFIPYEVDMLVHRGFEAVHLGPRILRVETAVTSLLSRLFV